MNHFTLHTSKTITEVTIPEDESIWGTWATELASENDFLLHGLFSLSSLHLVLCSISPQKNTVTAIHHHGLGLALFRPQLPTENFDAVFAFSCVVAFYSFGIHRASESEMDPITTIHQVLTLIRRSAVIVKSDHEVMKQSRWSVLMAHDPPG